jgi:hypothetical protein
MMFPADARNPYNLTTAAANITATYGGWNLETDRLWVTNAKYDPWRSASISSDQGPKEPSTTNQPIEVLPYGIHCWDLLVKNWVCSGILHRKINTDRAYEECGCI